MSEHFRVGALVSRRELDDVVEHQNTAISLTIEHLDVLELALLIRDQLAAERDRLRVALMELLGEGFWHRQRCSVEGRERFAGAN
jgi:hypothetical protein